MSVALTWETRRGKGAKMAVGAGLSHPIFRVLNWCHFDSCGILNFPAPIYLASLYFPSLHFLLCLLLPRLASFPTSVLISRRNKILAGKNDISYDRGSGYIDFVKKKLDFFFFFFCRKWFMRFPCVVRVFFFWEGKKC